MQAATSCLHPAIVSKGAELFAYPETKRERFMQMRVQKDVKGTMCKRCREDGESSASRNFLPFNHLLTIERLPAVIREQVFDPYVKYDRHLRSLFHSCRYNLLRYLTQEHQDTIRFPKAFAFPLDLPEQQLELALGCPFCQDQDGGQFKYDYRSQSHIVTNSACRNVPKLMQHLQSSHLQDIPEDLRPGVFTDKDGECQAGGISGQAKGAKGEHRRKG